MQLDVKDAAGIFNVPEKTIHRWVKQKMLPAYCIDEQYRFNRAELLEWATARRIGVSSEIMVESAAEAGHLPRLAEALESGGIHYRVEGTDKNSVLRSVVDRMPVAREVDRAFLHEVLSARESLGSTALGEGIAIPHVRNPIVLHILEPTITLCFLEHPIDFGAPDGLPVDILFTLVSPTVRSHLHLLSKLASALRDPRFKAVVVQRGTREEIISEAHRIEESVHS